MSYLFQGLEIVLEYEKIALFNCNYFFLLTLWASSSQWSFETERHLQASVFVQLCCNCLKCELMEENQTIKHFVFNPDIEMRLAKAKMTLGINT